MWASLAQDYLPIQATSVSSERAFSQGGLTISDRRSRLKGDVVEALQFLKCAIRHNLVYCVPDASSRYEQELEDLDSVLVAGSSPANTAACDSSAWDLALDEDDVGFV